MSPFFLALERGYFRGVGLDARPQVVNNSAEAATLLAVGRLDAAFTTVSPALMNAVARGSEVRVVLGRDIVTPVCGDAGALYARKSAFPEGVSDIRRWNGKRIWAGPRMGTGEFMLDLILRRAGLDPMRTPHVSLALAEATAALISGGIDAMLNGNNLPLNLHSHLGIVRETAGSHLLSNLQISHVLFGPGLLKGNIAAGVSFLACYLRAFREYQAGATPQFLRDLVAIQGRDPAVLSYCRNYSVPDGKVDMGSIDLYVDWAVERGYVQQGFKDGTLVDGRFAETAYKESMIH